MPKSTKRFVLSTSQLNSHKFRSLTAGADISDFIANPIMYWLHVTPEGKSADELLPIGFWEDIQVDGDEISAIPNFDDSDDFAMKIYKKVEHGTLRAASVEVDPVEVDADKANWVEGQKLPTVTKWRMGEASIVDRGSNKGALVKLKHEGRTIQLSDQASASAFFLSLQKHEEDTMKITLNKKTAGALKLSEGAEIDATEVVEKLVDLVETKEAEVVKLKNAATESAIDLMLDKAEQEGKILGGQKIQLKKLALIDKAGVQEYLDGIKPTEKLRDAFAKNAKTETADEAEVTEMAKLSWEELDKAGKLERLRDISPESYKLVYKKKFGKEPTIV